MDLSAFIKQHRIDCCTMRMRVPLFCHIEVTTRCNVGCAQCYMKASDKGIDMSLDLYKDIIDQLSSMGVTIVLLTGGEPLLHSRIVDMVEYASSYNIHTHISTSGINLSWQDCLALKKAGITKLWVSLNGSNKEIHSLSRGHFAESILAVDKCIEYSLPCGINWVARSDNVADFKNLLQFCQTKRVNEITVLQNKKQDGIMVSELTCEELICLANTIQSAKGISINIDPCFTQLKRLLGYKSFPFDCSAGRTFFDILSDGKVTRCRHIAEEAFSNTECNLQQFWDTLNLSYANERNCK